MSFAPEDRFITRCSRVIMSEDAVAEATRLLAQGLDWGYLLETSIRHGVSPLLYHGLNQVGQTVVMDGLIPSSIYQELHRLYQGNRSRNQRLYHVLQEIVEAYERAGIQVMGLKDIQLAREVYPDIGLRPMGDLDLLIHQQDYDRAAICMSALGFVPLPSPDIPYTLKYAWAHHWRRPTDNVWVDLQWNVLQLEWDVYGEGSLNFEIDRMWRGAVQMSIEESKLWVPSLEDMFFHLCLHLEGHYYSELILFCDIAEFLQHYEGQLDWDYLAHLAHRYHIESSIYYVLFLVNRMFAVDVPSFLWQELEPTYLKASLFRPLFGNLTHLHVSLDEISQAVRPPADVMAGFETAVRQQAIAAMQIYCKIDHIVSTFTNQAGRPAILDGMTSRKTIPDPLLEPFQDIHLFILSRDLPPLRQVLLRYGFQVDHKHTPETYNKTWAVVSRDPVLAAQPVRLILDASVITVLADLIPPNKSGSESKKDVALSLLKDKLVDRQTVPGGIPVQLKIVALSPEDLLIYLAARLGNQKQDRLFGLISLLEFFRCYKGSIDWHQVAHQAQSLKVAAAVGEGLSMADEILDKHQMPPLALSLFADAAPQPRVLELARYGPDSLGLYAGFKAPFFFLLSFLSIHGLRGRCRYLLRCLIGDQDQKPILPRLALTAGANLISRIRRRQKRTISSMAFWVEPPQPVTASGNGEQV
jgi:hypothetical protein